MRRLSGLALILLFSMTCTRKAERETVTAPKPKGRLSTIAGNVRYLAGNNAIEIREFEVSLKRGTDTVKSEKTDQFGTFHFTGLEPGSYTVCWGGSGWENGCTEELAVKERLSAYANQITPSASVPSSVVYGRVRLADGGPPSFRETDKVEVLDATGNVVASATTNANSEYIVANAPGAARVRASAGSAKTESKLAAAEAGAPKSLDLAIANRRPIVTSIEVLKGNQPVVTAVTGETITLRPKASDPDQDPLTHTWTVQQEGGTITENPDGSATWTLPNARGRYSVYFRADDGKGGVSQRKVSISAGGAAAAVAVSCPTRDCQPLSLAKVPPPYGYSPGPPPTAGFLTFKGTTDNSVTYYKNVDPNNLRRTLGEWWKAAGFDGKGGGGISTAYVNWNDLGFGRAMHFRKDARTNYVYAWVTNYGCPNQAGCNADLAKAADPTNAVATVCMEYAPIETDSGKTPFVKFFVYQGGEAGGKRLGDADLDEYGAKPVPNLCTVCHGGDQYQGGDQSVNLGANFIPFDLAFLRYPPGGVQAPPTGDLPTYYEMNQMILATNPTDPIRNLITGWYESSTTTQNDNYIPPNSWGLYDGPKKLYRTVIAPGCRACHYSFDYLTWDSYADTVRLQGSIKSAVCDSSPFMPQAAVTYVNMWTNAYHFANPPMEFLGNFSEQQFPKKWISFGGCTGK